MKNKFYKLIVTILTLIVAGSLFVACDDQGEDKKYDHLVTFNYNVGNLGDGFENQYLGVMDGSVVAIKPGYSDAYKEASLKGYYIEGWYTAKTDGEGKVIVGDDGRVQLDEKWDFETGTVSSDLTLYANFVQQASLIVTGGDKDVTYTGLPGSTKTKPSNVLAPKKAGWTFLGYYADAEYTQEFSWPYQFEAGVTTYVYARFMEGEWSMVSNADEFTLALAAKKNIYVTADLDFTGKDWSKGISYGGEIAGNGHTFSGISLELEASKSFNKNFGLFGTLTATANLHDFTIENAQISFTDGGFMSVGYKVAMFAWEMEAGAKLTNITVSGGITQGSVEPTSVVEYYKASANDKGAVITNCNFDNITLPTND